MDTLQKKFLHLHITVFALRKFTKECIGLELFSGLSSDCQSKIFLITKVILTTYKID